LHPAAQGYTLADMQKYAILPAPFGCVGMIAGHRGLARLLLLGSDPALAEAAVRKHYPQAERDPDLLPEFQRQLLDYFAGRRVRFRVPLDLEGLTPFQMKVLEACGRVGYGRTVTYGELARSVGQPAAARAVGGALAANPVPIVIPCHRIVASSGRLGGFSAEQGVSLKEALLRMERGSSAAGVDTRNSTSAAFADA
jgi:methylated-DNA-[protein]-cysteine S-methyltransferase